MWLVASILLLSAAPGVLSTPLSVFERPGTDNVRLIWQHDKADSKVSLTLKDADGVKTYAQACDHKLDTGEFANSPIVMEVNENGFGSLVYGDKQHKIH
jgi:hypothetical protein